MCAARAVMILGTHSHAGKSAMATAFCRILARRGLSVAPFKAQNMSNNAGVTAAGGEMGRSQIAQAEAAGVAPHTDMNPVLLKPEADCRSQVVLNGRVHGHIEAANWRDLKRTLWDAVRASYDRLASRFDIIVMEGAGSPAEINLKSMDIVNLPMARYALAPCVLVGDIDRGGVFAALAGTMLLLDAGEREQIKAFLINKFRGDPTLLGDATEVLQQRAYGVPCLGVVPFLPYLELPAEDAVRLDDGRGDEAHVFLDIAVVQWPHIANFDEFEVLASEPGVRLRYVRDVEALGRPDAVILPGTKATLADLNWLRQRQLDKAILGAARRGAAVSGICGGYQILGCKLSDPDGVEGPAGKESNGLGLLSVETRFLRDKQTHRARLRTQRDATVLDGYEIHTGDTRPVADGDEADVPFGTLIERNGVALEVADGSVSGDGRIWGTYLHGVFANPDFRRSWLRSLGWRHSAEATSAAGEVDASEVDASEAAYDRLADAVEAAVGWPAISRLLSL